MQVTTIGLDIAKNVFQVHGIDAAEKVVVRKQLRRSQVLAFFKALPPCLIGMEACAMAIEERLIWDGREISASTPATDQIAASLRAMRPVGHHPTVDADLDL
jgi:transposase